MTYTHSRTLVPVAPLGGVTERLYTGGSKRAHPTTAIPLQRGYYKVTGLDFMLEISGHCFSFNNYFNHEVTPSNYTSVVFPCYGKEEETFRVTNRDTTGGVFVEWMFSISDSNEFGTDGAGGGPYASNYYEGSIPGLGGEIG